MAHDSSFAAPRAHAPGYDVIQVSYFASIHECLVNDKLENTGAGHRGNEFPLA